MAEVKYLTNYAIIYIRENGDVVIERRRSLWVGGAFAGFVLGLFGILFLTSAFSSFRMDFLLGAIVTFGLSYAIMRVVGRVLRQPNVLIEKERKRVSWQPTILGGEAKACEISEFAGVRVWSPEKPTIEDIIGGLAFYAGLVFTDGRNMALLKVPLKQCNEMKDMLIEATGLAYYKPVEKNNVDDAA